MKGALSYDLVEELFEDWETGNPETEDTNWTGAYVVSESGLMNNRLHEYSNTGISKRITKYSDHFLKLEKNNGEHHFFPNSDCA